MGSIGSGGAVSVGLIGHGRMGSILARNLHQAAAMFDLRAICDHTGAAAPTEHYRRHNGQSPEFFLDYRDLIASGMVEAVVIATPVDTHYEIARQALTARLDTLVEKPITANLKQARALAQEAARTDTVLLVDHTLLYEHAAQVCQHILQRLGKGALQSISMRRVQPFPPAAQASTFHCYDELAPHVFSLLHRYTEHLGDGGLLVESASGDYAASVSICGTLRGVSVAIDLSFEFGGSAPAQRVTRFHTDKGVITWNEIRHRVSGRQKIEVSGDGELLAAATQAAAQCDAITAAGADAIHSRQGSASANMATTQIIECGEVMPITNLLQSWHQLIASREGLAAPRDEAIKVMEMMQAGRRAH